MDGRPPTYDELLDLTRRQARQIDELRAEVERLKAELEQPGGRGSDKPPPSPRGRPRPTPNDRDARPGTRPAIDPHRRPSRSIAPSRSRCRRSARSATPRSTTPRSPSTTSTRSTCPSPSRSSPASGSRWPAARPATVGSRVATPSRPPTPWGRRRPVWPATARLPADLKHRIGARTANVPRCVDPPRAGGRLGGPRP